jgi:hypothetical protein
MLTSETKGVIIKTVKGKQKGGNENEKCKIPHQKAL